MVVNKNLLWWVLSCVRRICCPSLLQKRSQEEDQCSGQGILAKPTFSNRWLSRTNQSLSGQRLTWHKMRVTDVRLIRILWQSNSKDVCVCVCVGNVVTRISTRDKRMCLFLIMPGRIFSPHRSCISNKQKSERSRQMKHSGSQAREWSCAHAKTEHPKNQCYEKRGVQARPGEQRSQASDHRKQASVQIPATALTGRES